jgi:hypothetical protein
VRAVPERESTTVLDLAARLWDREFYARSRPPRPLPADSIFAAAISLVAADRIELATALAEID